MVDANLIVHWFGNELTERMNAKGVTHRQVAFATHVAPMSVLDYMEGAHFPSPWSLVLMAEYLGCTVDELLGYESRCSNNYHKMAPAAALYRDEDSFTPYLRGRIVQKMNELKMSEEELARRSGVNIQTIKKYLCVHSGSPRMINLLRLCDAFKCTPSELMGY